MITNNELQFKYENAMRSRYAERTCLAYEQDLERFFSFFKRKETIDLTAQEIEVYLNYLGKMTDKEGNLLFTDRTVNRHRAALSGLYDYVIEQGYRRDNPIRGVKSRQIKEEAIGFLTEREVQVLLLKIANAPRKDDYVAARDHLMIRLTLYTGLTSHEIIHLRFNQLDFESNCLVVYDVNQDARLVPLPSALKEEYEEYIAKRQGIVCENEEEAELVFVNQKGCQLKAQSFNNTLAKYAKKLRLFNGLSQSMLRHTYARQKIQEGVSAQQLSELLGHSNHYYTLRLYETWFKEANDLTIPKINY